MAVANGKNIYTINVKIADTISHGFTFIENVITLRCVFDTYKIIWSHQLSR